MAGVLLLTPAPVFQHQPVDAPELLDICRDERQIPGPRLAGDEHIVWPYRRAGTGQRRADLTGVTAVFPVEFYDLEQERIDQCQIVLPTPAAIGAIVKLVRGDR